MENFNDFLRKARPAHLIFIRFNHFGDTAERGFFGCPAAWLIFYIHVLSGATGKVKSGTGSFCPVQRKTTILMISGLAYMCDPFSRPFADGVLFDPAIGKNFLSVSAAGCTIMFISPVG